ncbi:MAG: carbon storage regulator CsrA [Alphaproteobacteria bacterium]
MLYLTRKIGDSIIINDDIEVTVVDVRGKSIKLGLTFPEDVSVYRHEVYERIQAEKAGEGATDGNAGGEAADAPDEEAPVKTTDGPAE